MNRAPDDGIPDISGADAYRRRIAELEQQLAEAEETLDAIRSGEVDAVVVGGPDNRRVYTLESADRPYRLLIEQMLEGAVMLSADGTILYANRALANLLAVAPERLLGRAFNDFLASEDRLEIDSLILRGGRAELGVRTGAGGVLECLVSLEDIETDGARVICGVVADLSQSKAAAQQLSDARSDLAAASARRESDERYRLILESATDYAILATDLQDRVTIWNTGARNILGWDAEETVGRPAPMIWTPEDRAAEVPQAETRRALETGRAEDERWHVRKDGSRFWANDLLMPLRNGGGAVIGFLNILRDHSVQRRAEENQKTLIHELNHRVKNTLATVQSIAVQTLRAAPSTTEALQALQQRLIALSRAHDVLTREHWDGAGLAEIVAQAMEPYAHAGLTRFRVDGPDVRLSPRLALAIAMWLQELATNAAKYGALSNYAGRVDIRWRLEDQARLLMRWREAGGPPVSEPTRRGFGTRLINGLRTEFAGDVRLSFEPAGLVCEMTAALA